MNVQCSACLAHNIVVLDEESGPYVYFRTLEGWVRVKAEAVQPTPKGHE